MKKLARLVARCADSAVDDSGLGELEDGIACPKEAIHDIGVLTGTKGGARTEKLIETSYPTDGGAPHDEIRTRTAEAGPG
jgi:hypothetical protein